MQHHLSRSFGATVTQMLLDSFHLLGHEDKVGPTRKICSAAGGGPQKDAPEVQEAEARGEEIELPYEMALSQEFAQQRLGLKQNRICMRLAVPWTPSLESGQTKTLRKEAFC